jgi:aspartyl/glutamyl-tRNA(Asn/Gln) amidotransferase C subunit
MISINKETLRQLCKMARIEVSEPEEAEMVKDLGSILGHFERLTIEEAIAGSANTEPRYPNMTLRADTEFPSLDRTKEVMSNVSKNGTDGTFFIVPKVLAD